MKWGIRRATVETGKGLRGRFRGAALDNVQRKIAVNTRAINGTSTREERIMNYRYKLLLGEEGLKASAKQGIDYYLAQADRIKTGKTNLADTMEFLGSVQVKDLLLTRTDNKG